MTDHIDRDRTEETARHAVIVGVVPDQPARVLREAARYASLLGVPLEVVHIDVTRFVTFEDPDGYVHSSPIDLDITVGEAQLAAVRAQVVDALEGSPVDWHLQQLVGDPAMAILHLAERIDARLIVVGTRRRGFGETVREFFTGSVAVRLAHRQARPVLVVPLDDPAASDEELWPDL